MTNSKKLLQSKNAGKIYSKFLNDNYKHCFFISFDFAYSTPQNISSKSIDIFVFTSIFCFESASDSIEKATNAIFSAFI